MWKNADVHRSDVTPPQLLLIECSATEPYYIMSVWHVEGYRHNQVRCTPPLIKPGAPKGLTTSCQFDMWKNAGIPRSDVHPSLVNPSATELYYTMSVWHVGECRHTQIRSTPLLINPSVTESYYTMSVWNVEECRHTHVRSTPLLINPSATEPYYKMYNPANWT